MIDELVKYFEQNSTAILIMLLFPTGEVYTEKEIKAWVRRKRYEGHKAAQRMNRKVSTKYYPPGSYVLFGKNNIYGERIAVAAVGIHLI